MVIRWSDIAEYALKGIFDYYLSASNNQTAHKIVVEIRNTTDKLGTMPYMAAIEPALTENPLMYRSLIVRRTNKVIYRIENETIYVADVWDCRQNPNKLKKRLRGEN